MSDYYQLWCPRILYCVSRLREIHIALNVVFTFVNSDSELMILLCQAVVDQDRET
jgi:hypothetical protein